MLNYPTLRAELAKRGIKKNVIARTLGISDRSLANKMNGITSWTWPEVCKVNAVFFPDMDKDTLFAEDDSNAKG